MEDKLMRDHNFYRHHADTLCVKFENLLLHGDEYLRDHIDLQEYYDAVNNYKELR